MEPADIYYFSGTGNTLLTCKEVAETLKERGIEAKLHPMEHSDPTKIVPGNTLGLAFPGAATVTYPLVYDFIRGIPPGRGAGAFALATLGGGTLNVHGYIKGMLKAKGYKPLGAVEIRMPFNTFIRKYDEKKTSQQIERGEKAARNFAVDLAEGKAHWLKIPLLPDFAAWAFGSRRAWRFYGSLTPLHRDDKKCVDCGLCEHICPSRSMKTGVKVENLPGCQLCLRCVSYCPSEALYYARNLFARYKAVNVSEFQR